ncbi:acyl-CoA thioesterase [Nonomuraea bangladeshensis]|uniref:Enediyne biosynthesis thioesterase n=2 Tax=Nonomuraea TaxID=83681 RepID=A0A1I0L4A6_9ACTN|nr:acyl-CoA thioesterase [Nonomuraea wenchangensis]SEU34401.1 enediyne biosynthesis thioesterase [Nonomuraea wenchangensis]
MRRTFAYEHTVTFVDTNLVGNVYFANYLIWQGACRERFLAEHAPGVIERLAADLALVTVSCSCEFFAELVAFDRVSVRMSLRGVEFNRIAMGFDYVRLNTGPGQLVARGAQTVACMKRVDGELVSVDVPDDLLRALDAYAVHPGRR